MDNQTVLQPGSEPMVKTMPGTVDDAPLKTNASASVDNLIAPSIPATPNQVSMPNPLSKKRGFSRRAWLITILAVLVVLGAGAWFYVAYGQAWWLNNGADLPNWQNYKANASLSLKVHDIKDAKGNPAKQDWLGLGENFSLENAGLGIIYSNHQSGNQSNGQVKLTLSAKDLNFNFSTIFKKIDKDVYVKPELNELTIPLLQNPLDLGEDWVTFTTDQLDQWSNETNASEANKSVEEYLKDSKQKEDEFFKRVKEQKFFTYKDTHESKPTPSGNIHKFEYKVVPAKLNDLVKTLDELMYDNKLTDDQKGFLNKFFEAGKVSVWINTKTKFIQEINVEALNISFKDDTGSVQLDIVLNYDTSEAEAQTVVKPEPTINWLDFSNKIVSQLMSPENYMPADSNVNLSVDSDNDGLPDDLEALYGTDPNKADTDGDGYNDAEEIDNGYNPLGPGKLDTSKM